MVSPVSGNSLWEQINTCNDLETLEKITEKIQHNEVVVNKKNQVFVLDRDLRVPVLIIRQKFEALTKGESSYKAAEIENRISILEGAWKTSKTGLPMSQRLQGLLPAVPEQETIDPPLSRLDDPTLLRRPQMKKFSPEVLKLLDGRVKELVHEWKVVEDKAFLSRKRINSKEMSEPLVNFMSQYKESGENFKTALELIYNHTKVAWGKEFANAKMRELLHALPKDSVPEDINLESLKARYK